MARKLNEFELRDFKQALLCSECRDANSAWDDLLNGLLNPPEPAPASPEELAFLLAEIRHHWPG